MRRLLRALPALAAAALAASGCRRGDGAHAQSAAHMHGQMEPAAPVDWGRVSMHDLDVASVFLTERDVGLRAALDTLGKLAARDEEIRKNTHQIAHAVGRFAVAQAHGSAAVFRECTAGFQSGCYHGVLEAYLEHAPVDGASVAAMCETLIRPGGPRLEYRECAHGLGHGLAGRLEHRVPPALALCDGLRAEDGRVECRDGVFMENVVNGLGAAGFHVGGEAAGHDHGGGGAMHPGWLRDDDVYFPCDSVAVKYQPSCWHYQYNVVLARNNGNVDATMRSCEPAPAASRRACWRGLGKLVAFLDPGGADAARQCRVAGEGAGWCIAGAAEYMVDLGWTTPPAHAFCSAVPDDLKPDCYGMIGERLALIYNDPQPIRSDCALAGAAYAPVCEARAGMGRGASTPPPTPRT